MLAHLRIKVKKYSVIKLLRKDCIKSLSKKFDLNGFAIAIAIVDPMDLA